MEADTRVPGVTIGRQGCGMQVWKQGARPAGGLFWPIVVHRVCQLIWFRGPITRTVSWAGKPDDKSDRFILGPRKSFARWVSQHEDQSAPWGEDQLESAREIFKEFLDIIDFNLIVDKEDYESYTQSLNAFFSQPLSPETIAIIDKMHNWPQ